MRSCSENYQRDAYILKLDISGFFMSIDRETLLEKIQDLICHSEARRICPVIATKEAIQEHNKDSSHAGLLRASRVTERKAGFSDEDKDKILAQVNSYLGLMSHTDSYRLREKMIERLDRRFWDRFGYDTTYLKIQQKTQRK